MNETMQLRPSSRALLLSLIPIIGWLWSPFLLYRTFTTCYEITATEVKVISGLRRDESIIPLKNVSYVTKKKPFAQWLLKCGTIEIIPNSGQRMRFSFVRNVDDVQSAIVQGMRGQDKDFHTVLTREVVKVPCTYCGALKVQTDVVCSNCGART